MTEQSMSLMLTIKSAMCIPNGQTRMYRILGEQALASEIMEMRELIEHGYQGLHIERDLGLGMMLGLSHFLPQESWSRVQTNRSLTTLDQLWIDPLGLFLSRPGPMSRQIRVHELRHLARLPGRQEQCGSCCPNQQVF
jgi:hypothetical protein